MSLLTDPNLVVLWRDVIKHAEERCSILLKEELEAYLVSLLIRYTNKPEVIKKVIATAFLEALQLRERERNTSLQHVGDQCLIYAGLFPRVAEKRHVKINYFVDLGQAAYSAISHKTNDLYGRLAVEFVVLMDVLQSIRPHHDLSPLDAYERWSELGSRRAFNILKEFTHGSPTKNFKE